LFNIVKGKVVPFIFGGWILFRFVVIYSNKWYICKDSLSNGSVNDNIHLTAETA
jgi:hypothetical protein